MNMQMTQETLLSGYEIISPYPPKKGKSEIRLNGQIPPVFIGTYKQCKAWARRRGLLRTQAPSAK